MIVNIISSNKGGGAEVLVRELHKIYLSKGLKSHVIYSTGSADELGDNETILGLNPRNPLNVFRIRKLLKCLSRESDQEMIVHVHLTWPLYFVTLACIGLKNIRLVYTEHSTNNNRRNIPLIWIIERIIYDRYDHIVCISEGVRKALANWVGPRISQRLITIPNGARLYSVVDRSELKGRLPRLVSVGSLSFRKNFDSVIKAIARLRNEIACYTIVGEGPERKKLEKIIHNESLEDKVKLVGWRDSVEGELCASDIQIIPSLWEGFGLVAVEGMSTGLPVVASNVDGLREVLGEKNQSVTLVNDPKSVDEWVSAIRVTINKVSSQGPRKLAILSRRQAEKFTIEKMAERYIDVYNVN